MGQIDKNLIDKIGIARTVPIVNLIFAGRDDAELGAVARVEVTLHVPTF